MQRKTRSLLEELEDIGKKHDTKYVIENRANNIIASAINLLEMIKKHYGNDKAEVLERKLLGAIKAKDQSKFSKTLKKTNNKE